MEAVALQALEERLLEPPAIKIVVILKQLFRCS